MHMELNFQYHKYCSLLALPNNLNKKKHKIRCSSKYPRDYFKHLQKPKRTQTLKDENTPSIKKT